MAIKLDIKVVPGGKKQTRAHETDAAFDCYVRLDTPFKLISGVSIIPLGFKLGIPKGWRATIWPRSSTGAKTPLRMSNSAGIIDSGYAGEVCAILETYGNNVFRIENGQRLVQMTIDQVPEVELVEVDELGDSARGTGGFGSTGIK